MRPAFPYGAALLVAVLPLLLVRQWLASVEGSHRIRNEDKLVSLNELLQGHQPWESVSTTPPSGSPESSAIVSLKQTRAGEPYQANDPQAGGPPALKGLRGDAMDFTGAPSEVSSVPNVGALRRLSYFIMNSSLADKVVSFFRYFGGSTPGRPEKALLRQSDSVGVGIGILLHVLRVQTPETREVFSLHLKALPEVKQFVRRFSELADPTRSVKESLLQLMWIRRTCARLALGAYDARHQGEFLSLVRVFRREYMHLLGFTAMVLNGLPRSFPALALLVDRLLVPLQDALRSVSSVSGRFPGFAVTLVQQQLLRWIHHLALLDAAILRVIPGGMQALASLQSTSIDSSIEDTDSRHGSQEEDFYLKGEVVDSHL